MNDTEKRTAAACDVGSLAATRQSSEARDEYKERALRLGRLLHIHAVVDQSGRLLGDVDLRYERGHRGTIQPVVVRVGPEASDEELLAEGGVFGRCRRYNDALDKLRELGTRLMAVIQDRLTALVAGSALACAYHELSRLDALIAERQTEYMAHGSVRLHRLVREIMFFEGRHAYLMQIVLAAEQGVLTAWEGDTQEMKFDD